MSSSSAHDVTGMTGQFVDESGTWQKSRRGFLRLATAGLVANFFAPSVFAQADPLFWSQPRHLWLKRRTIRGVDEEFKGVYFADGQLLLEPYIQICTLMRDEHVNIAVQMSPTLLDILCGIQGIARVKGHEEPLHTLSGYRSPTTNAKTEGAAPGSKHLEGRAWDGRINGYGARAIAESAQYLWDGGVGLYMKRNFCHIDDGSLRSWRG